MIAMDLPVARTRVAIVPPVADDARDVDEAIVVALWGGDRAAAAALFDRHAPHVRRVLRRILGPDPETCDLLQDVFVHALRDIRRLRDPRLVGAWLTGIAVHVARRAIRKRRRWAWIRFFAPESVPDVAAAERDDVAAEQLAATFRILAELPTDERIAFSLRILDGMDLSALAAACGVSVATTKRRLQRAVAAFRAAANDDPALRDRLALGSRA